MECNQVKLSVLPLSLLLQELFVFLAGHHTRLKLLKNSLYITSHTHNHTPFRTVPHPNPFHPNLPREHPLLFIFTSIPIPSKT